MSASRRRLKEERRLKGWARYGGGIQIWRSQEQLKERPVSIVLGSRPIAF
jgi:hypothetical protein